MPPRPPVYLGQTVVVREVDGEMLEIRPRGGTIFSSPQGTHTLYVPLGRLVSVTPQGAGIEVVGEFSQTNYPPQLHLGPLDPADAKKLCAALARRYGLPRFPAQRDTLTLRWRRVEDFVCIEDEVGSPPYSSGMLDGVLVSGVDHRAWTPGRRIRVTGFYHDGYDVEGVPLPIGHRGATLSTVRVEDARYASVALDHAGGRVDARLGDGHGRYLGVRSPNQRLVGLLHMTAEPGVLCGSIEAHLRALRGLIAGEPEGPPPEEPTTRSLTGWIDAGVADAVAAGPLPESAAELLVELDRRLGVIFEECRSPPGVGADGVFAGVGADGVLACVEGRRVTVLRRGLARIYRAGQHGLRPVIVEEALALAAAPDPADPLRQRETTTSFGAPILDGVGTAVLDLGPDERLIAVTGEVLRQRADAVLTTALAEPSLVAAVARIEDHTPPLEDDHWGILVIAPGVDGQP